MTIGRNIPGTQTVGGDRMVRGKRPDWLDIWATDCVVCGADIDPWSSEMVCLECCEKGFAKAGSIPRRPSLATLNLSFHSAHTDPDGCSGEIGPNPCFSCPQHDKFREFWGCREELGCDALKRFEESGNRRP